MIYRRGEIRKCGILLFKNRLLLKTVAKNIGLNLSVSSVYIVPFNSSEGSSERVRGEINVLSVFHQSLGERESDFSFSDIFVYIYCFESYSFEL